jgi:transcriptional regulator with XRE-family HTH domain
MSTGTDLRLKRTAMNVTVSDLADRIGVPASSVSRWETSLRVPVKAEARYLTALATFGTIPTVTVSHPSTGQDAA